MQPAEGFRGEGSSKKPVDRAEEHLEINSSAGQGIGMLEAKLSSVVRVVSAEPRHATGELSSFPNLPSSNPPQSHMFLARPEAGSIFINKYSHLASIYKKVVAHGVPNYRGARVPLTDGINIAEWRKVSHMLSDKSLPDMLAFGFLSGHKGRCRLRACPITPQQLKTPPTFTSLLIKSPVLTR